MPDETDLLSILNAHGQNFLSSFSQPPHTGNKKRKRATKDEHADSVKVRIVHEEGNNVDGSEDGEEEDDEWLGFGSKGGESSAETDEDGESEDQGSDEDEFSGSGDEIEGASYSRWLRLISAHLFVQTTGTLLVAPPP